MTLTPQKARGLLADLEKPFNERAERDYQVETPIGTHCGPGREASFYDAAAHITDLLRFYADNADEPAPRTLADLPEEQWPGTRVRDMAGGSEGEALGYNTVNTLQCCVRFDNQPASVCTWPAAELALVDTIDETTVRLPLDEDTTVECGTEENTGPHTLAELNFEDWIGCYIEGPDGQTVKISKVKSDPLSGDYESLLVRRGAISYRMPFTAQDAAQTTILGREDADA
ncbi:hypothetical protein [Corynebacterium pygosceleis]|uniref:hypothetical protein n=1 Tax=Corynebacterium pygosceleis TaxID=2800406 RepID=UPI002004279D|nr:hypothetical protein [Corynebacterium pygosceleis]MCK7676393.1 hypothetical protein [Corynebacterium pygosceleis]